MTHFKKLGALLFLFAVGLMPVAIVILRPEDGGFWVAGYAIGIATVPLLAITALRALAQLLDGDAIEIGLVWFGICVLLVSVSVSIFALAV